MEILTKALLFCHVIAGSIALVCAFVAISVRKGGRLHNRVGKIYFWSMMAIAITAIPVAIIRPNIMLFLVALFSSYMAYIGWRFGNRSRYLGTRRPVIPVLMLVVGIFMIGTGLVQVFSGTPMGWALAAFGGIGLQFSISDIRVNGTELSFADRITMHLTHMLGGTIATVTAVLVQQVVPRMGADNPWVVAVWLAPTLVITPLIGVWATAVQKTKKAKLSFTK